MKKINIYLITNNGFTKSNTQKCKSACVSALWRINVFNKFGHTCTSRFLHKPVTVTEIHFLQCD